MKISAEHQTRVRDAIRRAEEATSADFVCVLARNAGSYDVYPLMAAALLALATPWALFVLSAWPVVDILLTQLLVFVTGFAVLSIPVVSRSLVPRRIGRAAAHRAATEQFFVRGLASTPQRRGVLIFVAEGERYARVLADDGVASVISADHWRKAIDLLVAASRAGRHADGFVAALDHCGAVLAQALPPETGRPNALPDKFYIID